MKRILAGVFAAGLLAVWPVTALAQEQPERWLHVRVEDTGAKAERVRVNIPLSFAEKVLPSIKINDLEGGRIRLHRHGHHGFHGADIRAVLDAVRSTRDGEFVTVETEKEKVRVAKSQGYLLVQVRGDETVDVKVPITVVEALVSGGPDELNIAAAVQALKAHGDILIVDVKDKKETVRIWVDTKSEQN